MRLPAAIFLGVVSCTGFASAQQAAGERLFVPPPDGWKIALHERQGNVEVTELVPPGQSAQEWSEMLTVQMVGPKPDNKDAQKVLAERVEAIRKECEDIGAGPVNLGNENGYETALRAVGCTRSNRWGKGEISLFKVLVGRDRLYVVSRSWSGPPYEKAHVPLPATTTQAWLAFMQKVVLCDSRDPQHPCPSNKGASGPRG